MSCHQCDELSEFVAIQFSLLSYRNSFKQVNKTFENESEKYPELAQEGEVTKNNASLKLQEGFLTLFCYSLKFWLKTIPMSILLFISSVVVAVAILFVFTVAVPGAFQFFCQYGALGSLKFMMSSMVLQPSGTENWIFKGSFFVNKTIVGANDANVSAFASPVLYSEASYVAYKYAKLF